MRKILFLITSIINIVLIITFGVIIGVLCNEQNRNITLLNEKVYKPIDELTLRKVKVAEMQLFINKTLFVDPWQLKEINVKQWETEKTRQNLFELLDELSIDDEDREIITEIQVDYNLLIGLYNNLDEIFRKRNRVDSIEYSDRLEHIQSNLFNLIDLKIKKCMDFETEIRETSQETIAFMKLLIVIFCAAAVVLNITMGTITMLKK